MRSKPIRVLLLSPTKITGGITTWTRILLRYSDPAKVDYEIVDTSRSIPLGSRWNLSHLFRRVGDAWGWFTGILKQLRVFRPHLVYFTCAAGVGMAYRDAPCMLLLRMLGVRYVAHLRGGDVRRFFYAGPLRGWLVRAALRRATAVLVITRKVEEVVKEFLDDEQIIYMPNMFDDEQFASYTPGSVRDAGETPMTLLHVAWQAPQKGSLDLVEAMAHVKTPVFCRLVGKAAPENETLITERIKVLGVADRIGLAGMKDRHEVAEEFRQADLFVFPSHTEGFPNVIMEAMAYGVPIIATDVGNIREMIGADTDHPAGLLLEQVNSVDPRELADKVDLLLGDPELRRGMSENGRRRIRENYLATKVVPLLEDTIRQLVCGPAESPMG